MLAAIPLLSTVTTVSLGEMRSRICFKSLRCLGETTLLCGLTTNSLRVETGARPKASLMPKLSLYRHTSKISAEEEVQACTAARTPRGVPPKVAASKKSLMRARYHASLILTSSHWSLVSICRLGSYGYDSDSTRARTSMPPKR